MRIKLDDNNYIEVFEKNKSIFLSIKADKDDNSFILLTTKLNEESLDNLITSLVKLKGRLE